MNKFLFILNWADMIVNADGVTCSYEERLTDFVLRHGMLPAGMPSGTKKIRKDKCYEMISDIIQNASFAKYTLSD